MNSRVGKKRKSKQDDDDSTDPKVVKPSSAKDMPNSIQCGKYLPSDPIAKVSTKLDHSFFDVPCTELAQRLLGQYIVRAVGTQRIRGKIVETEAYIGPIDKAAHSYQGKRTARNEAMFLPAGTSYVYNIYGMYCCLNISSQGDGAAVLVRALEPLEGHELMKEGRTKKDKSRCKPLKDKDLCNGPSKLCQALHITKDDFDQKDLTASNFLWLERGLFVDIAEIVSCPRINIGYAEDWKEKPLRFYIKGNAYVSVKDKKAEEDLQSASNG